MMQVLILHFRFETDDRLNYFLRIHIREEKLDLTQTLIFIHLQITPFYFLIFFVWVCDFFVWIGEFLFGFARFRLKKNLYVLFGFAAEP
jgi:uncharacterized membrane protein YjdF